MRTFARLTAATVVLIPALAWAGGEEYPDNGAQALSRGGAFTAKADDLTALQYNVAGIAKTRGTRFLLSANLVSASASFARTGSYTPNNGAPQPYDNQLFPTVSNSGGPFFAPMIVAASDFGLNHWTFAGGIFGPSAYGGLTFPKTVTTANGSTAPAPERYDFIDADLFVAYPTLAVAYRLLDFISVGAAFHWVYLHSKFHQASYLPPADPTQRENAIYDYDIKLDVQDSFEPSFSLGALARLTDYLEVGLNYRHSTELDASGSAVAVADPANPTQPSYDNGKFAIVDHFRTSLPKVLRGGARYIWKSGDTERADVEVDFTWEGWSTVQDVTIAASHVSPPTQLVRSPHRYNDTFSARVGGQYNWDTLAGVWSGRAGIYYDSAAAPEEWTRLDFRAWDHTGFCAGVGWQWGGLTANLGGAYVLMLDRDVSNSQLRQTHSLGGSPADPAYSIVGNGKWSASYSTITFSLEYKFDPFR